MTKKEIIVSYLAGGMILILVLIVYGVRTGVNTLNAVLAVGIVLLPVTLFRVIRHVVMGGKSKPAREAPDRSPGYSSYDDPYANFRHQSAQHCDRISSQGESEND